MPSSRKDDCNIGRDCIYAAVEARRRNWPTPTQASLSGRTCVVTRAWEWNHSLLARWIDGYRRAELQFGRSDSRLSSGCLVACWWLIFSAAVRSAIDYFFLIRYRFFFFFLLGFYGCACLRWPFAVVQQLWKVSCCTWRMIVRQLFFSF